VAVIISQPIQLIVGLGNPGAKYEQTRHNAGFWFLDQWLVDSSIRLKEDKNFQGLVGRMEVASESIWCLKPATFMNRSGQSVRALSYFYKIPVEQILVVHDELDLPVGVARLKRGGGHGGHNGLRDISDHLGKDFMRLRIGIDHPGNKDQVIDYVLDKPSKQHRALIDRAIEDACAVMPMILAGEFDRAMNQLHTK